MLLLVLEEHERKLLLFCVSSEQKQMAHTPFRLVREEANVARIVLLLMQTSRLHPKPLIVSDFQDLNRTRKSRA